MDYTHTGYRTRLEAVIKGQGRRYQWVADEVGVDISAIYKWCDGTRNPTPENIAKLAEKLGVLEVDLTGVPAQAEMVS